MKKKVIFRVVAVLVVALMAWGGYSLYKKMPHRQQQVPTTRVRRGEVVIRAFARGELRAVRSVTLTAPNLFSTVQVTRLAALGSLAKEKDLVVEFDDSERRAAMEETLLEVEQTDEQIKKALADQQMRANQDEVDLLRARYAVRRSELEVQRNPILSEIDRKKNNLNLKEATQRLKQLESDIQSRRAQAQAELAVLREQRNKSMIDVGREKQRIAQAKVLAPMGGLVALRPNRQGGMFFGQQMPDLREGDTVFPGMQIADVLDLSELEVVAKVGELDRANLRDGQDVLLRLDAFPDQTFNGKIKSMSGTATTNVWSGDPGKKFDIVFSMDMRQLLKALGAKPEQIQRIMEMAERNAKKGVPTSAGPSMFAMAGMGGAGGMGAPMGAGGMGGPGASQDAGGGRMQAFQPGGGSPGGMMGGAPGEGAGAGGAAGAGRDGGRSGGGGGGRGSGMSQLSEEDRKKFRDAFQKALKGRNPQDLTPEERQKMFSEVRDQLPASARTALGASPGNRQGGSAATAGPAATPGSAATPASAGEQGGGREGRRSGGRGGSGPGGPGGPGDGGIPRMGNGTPWSDAELANANLPPPPEEESQLDVLLRPGLLADVEIFVERIPNAIYVPVQAVFEREGKTLVYIRSGGRFEPRPVKLARRSESAMVIQEGLKPDEIVALSDPMAGQAQGKKKEGEKSGGGNALGGFGGGKQ